MQGTTGGAELPKKLDQAATSLKLDNTARGLEDFNSQAKAGLARETEPGSASSNAAVVPIKANGANILPSAHTAETQEVKFSMLDVQRPADNSQAQASQFGETAQQASTQHPASANFARRLDLQKVKASSTRNAGVSPEQWLERQEKVVQACKVTLGLAALFTEASVLCLTCVKMFPKNESGRDSKPCLVIMYKPSGQCKICICLQQPQDLSIALHPGVMERIQQICHGL